MRKKRFIRPYRSSRQLMLVTTLFIVFTLGCMAFIEGCCTKAKRQEWYSTGNLPVKK